MIVGSLTTISQRINNLYRVVESLYNQTTKLDKLYLFISTEGYLLDKGITEIPENLNKYIDNKFLVIEFVDNDGPYRKFTHIIKRFQNECEPRP